MNAAELIRLLQKEGWVLKGQKGSHKQYVHPRKRVKITVPDHGKKDIAKGPFYRILKRAGLK
jgi:predicted RNA binding protein YcfA (HicA-like mRNA interferase family)